FHDAHHYLPEYYGYPGNYTWPYEFTGCWNFQLLPYVEQDNIYNGSYGEFTYSYSGGSYDYRGLSHHAQRPPNQPLKVFLSPLDYSAKDVTAPSSYLANYYPLNGSMKLEQITDGTSNTIFYAEGLANCQQQTTYDYSASGYIYNETYGGKRS